MDEWIRDVGDRESEVEVEVISMDRTRFVVQSDQVSRHAMMHGTA